MLDEAIGPSGLGGGGAADAQARADVFQGAGGGIVKLEVGWFFRSASPEIDVRLVPYFEIPLRNFVEAVAVHQMLCELADEFGPLFVALGRGDVGLVPEILILRFGGQLFGHEAQFDEGPHTGLQQAVVDLVHVGEVVDRFTGGVFVIEADFVMENCVEADVFEIRGGFHFA